MYWKDLKGMMKLTLDSIIPFHKPCTKRELLSTRHESITTIGSEPFYVNPNFSSVAEKKNAHFILFSAPGATGKSALAKYISYKYNGIYWDLSKIKLGDNSFHGTILRAIGASNFSGFVNDLNTSNALLVIDAFDEAEMSSGRNSIENLLMDIDGIISNCQISSVILFARTETSEFIASFCLNRNILISHYEIGFFNESNARDFVVKRLAAWGKDVTDVSNQCINEYFEKIKKLLSENDNALSFLGYAPVLEAIATHISEETNVSKLLSCLKSEEHSFNIINTIMNDLVERESIKVQNAFRTRCEGKSISFDAWEKVYTKKEQIFRIVFYIVFKDNSYENYRVKGLPAQLIEDYNDVINTFLPQHPFIQSSHSDSVLSSVIDFTGPAFRDYAIANLLLCKDGDDFVDWYFEAQKSSSLFPSQLFWDFYTTENNNRVFSHQFSYLYESFKSKAKISEYNYLQVLDSDGELTALFITKSKERNDLAQEIQIDVTDKGLVIDQLSNAVVDVELPIHFGHLHDDIHISNANVFCKKLYFNAKKVSIESHEHAEPKECVLVSQEPVEIENSGNPDFQIYGNGRIKIDFPNIKSRYFYKLYTYKYTVQDVEDLDIITFIHYLRTIFIVFRAHGKDTPAKDAERVDNVVIASNKSKRSVFDYLLSKGVFFKDQHLYKIDTSKMQALKINWDGVMQGMTDQLQSAYDGYLAWKKGL